MDQVDTSGLVPPLPPLLGPYVRNRLLHINDRAPAASDVQEAMDDAIRLGSPELHVEASAYLAKVGSVHSPTLWGSDSIEIATLEWKGHVWVVYDYSDQLPCPSSRQATLQPEDGPKPDVEPRQCLVLHVAAALLLVQKSAVPSHDDVITAAQRLRDHTISAAQDAAEKLGDAPDASPGCTCSFMTLCTLATT